MISRYDRLEKCCATQKIFVSLYLSSLQLGFVDFWEFQAQLYLHCTFLCLEITSENMFDTLKQVAFSFVIFQKHFNKLWYTSGKPTTLSAWSFFTEFPLEFWIFFGFLSAPKTPQKECILQILDCRIYALSYQGCNF